MSLKNKKDVIERFMKAYREAIDWMYTDPKALEIYAAKMKVPVALVKKALPKFASARGDAGRPSLRLDGIMRDAVANKFLDEAADQGTVRGVLSVPPGNNGRRPLKCKRAAAT